MTQQASIKDQLIQLAQNMNHHMNRHQRLVLHNSRTVWEWKESIQSMVNQINETEKGKVLSIPYIKGYLSKLVEQMTAENPPSETRWEYVSREEAQTWSNQITHLLDQLEEALTEAPTIAEEPSPALEELLNNRLRRLVNHLWTGNESLNKNVRDALVLVGAAINDVLNNDDEGAQSED